MEIINQKNIWYLFDIMDIDTDAQDMAEIKEMEEEMSSIDRTKTLQILDTQRFRDWLLSPGSARLLIHGNFHGNLHGPLTEASALSLLCTTLTKAFHEQNPRALCLTWFCGFHLGEEVGAFSDDPNFRTYSYQGRPYDPEVANVDEHVLPYARQGVIGEMLRSFIVQLLNQHDFGSAELLPPDVRSDTIQQNKRIDHLMVVFRWMIGLLPRDTTLFVLVDGIAHYESTNYQEVTCYALDSILTDTALDTRGPGIKLLVTSPRRQSTYERYFEHGKTLSVDHLPPSFEAYSDDGVIRRLLRMRNGNFIPRTVQSWNR
ncbi:hypothetical protein GGR53DRAFT_516101 [Hypoxylon sp. FL1150]|nr:hypothetical protein GGR53DRAFT_516101 [Hypoxylon sp. FL1150]